jgi:hypothetical protein
MFSSSMYSFLLSSASIEMSENPTLFFARSALDDERTTGISETFLMMAFLIGDLFPEVLAELDFLVTLLVSTLLETWRLRAAKL